MSNLNLREEFLNLLEKDKVFRHAVAGLIGYKELFDRMVKVEKRFRRYDKKFNAILEEIKKLREDASQLRQDMLEGFRRHDEELMYLRIAVTSLSKSVDELSVNIGSLGRRVGKDLERLILNIYRDQLMQIGIDKDKARRFEYIDKEGLYGTKGKKYEFDIIVSNGYADIIEVKNPISEEDIVTFHEKVNSIRPVIGYNIKRLIAVAVNMDAEAVDKAKELGIECIYGHVIRD
ncbi:MAG: DUF3782 domain-containing protein [Candidatus Nitrosocaldus sp.]